MNGSNPAESIHVTGKILNDDESNLNDPTRETIWVWTDRSNHYIQGKQFATVDSKLNKKYYKVFRNAVCDKNTRNSTNGFLTGVGGPKKGGKTCIYWDPDVPMPEGSTKVILRKVDGSYGPLEGKEFRIMSGNKVIHDNLTSGTNGIFFNGMLEYGTYNIVEISPAKTYTITVTKDGVEEKEYRK